MNRRDLLVRSAALAAAAPLVGLAGPASAARLTSIGVRPFNIKPDNAAQTFHDLEATGFKEIEVPYADVEACWPVISKSPMKKVTVYIDGTLTAPGKEDELKRAVEQVKKWGFEYASVSYREVGRGASISEKYKIFGEQMNHAGVACKAAGLGPLLYHNQVFEFTPENGTDGYTLLTAELDPKLCALEMDVYWISLAGHDPVDYLKKLSGRVRAMHFKDKPAGLKPMYEHAPGPGNFLDVGDGSMDWPAILRAAKAAGVQHYIVEPDSRSAADMVTHSTKSYQYLSKLNF